MNQAEQEIFLGACDTAFLAFQHRNPDFVFSEALAREMALTLQTEGLDPRNVHHLSAAWLKVRPTPAPQPVQVSESTDALTLAAKQLISSCGGEHATRALIAEMSATEYQRRSTAPVFVRADELVNRESRARQSEVSYRRFQNAHRV